MGGKKGGNSTFVERGTPLSSEDRAQYQNLFKEKIQAKQPKQGEGGGDDNARGYEGGTGLSPAAVGVMAGILGTAVTGNPVTGLTLGYQAYTSAEDGVLGNLLGLDDDAKDRDAAAVASARTKDSVFGSLLDNADGNGKGNDGFGGDFGSDTDGGQGKGGTTGAYA